MTDRDEHDGLTNIALVRELATISAELRMVREALNELRELPLRVQSLVGRITALERDVQEIREENVRGVEWRRVQLPAFVLTLVIALASAVAAITQLH